MSGLCNCIASSVVLTVLLTPTAIFGADLAVTDVSGTRVEVTDVSIDYTHYPFMGFYTPDHEAAGVRIYQGAGTVLVEWSRIRKVTILEKREDVTPWHLRAELLIGLGPTPGTRSVQLVLNSRDGLSGSTPFGEFSIDLEKVRTIEPLPKRGVPTTVTQAFVATVLVTDMKGTVVRLKNPSGSPRLSLGAGTVRVPLELITRIDLTGTDASTMKAVVQYEGQGQREFVGVATGRREQLSGETELGEFKISWTDVAAVVVERQPPKKPR